MCEEECHEQEANYKQKIIVSSILLISALICENYILSQYKILNILLYTFSYYFVGYPVIKAAFNKLKSKDFFNEFSLMSIATIGAFIIGEYAEGVAVMLFYSLGEYFQDSAVGKATQSIESLIKTQSNEVTLVQKEGSKQVDPKNVKIGSLISVKPGEKIGLDGELTTSALVDSSVLTGESKPLSLEAGDQVYAGMINSDQKIEIKVTKKYSDTKLSQILELVKEASSKKSKTERFITKFAKVYTPVVTLLAVLIVVIPFFIVENYIFSEFLYRALVFLVISCPCALVISIPLGYFGGIGAASKNGILVKGANYLDLLCEIDSFVFDKTGTLTEGSFNVDKYDIKIDEDLFWTSACSLAQNSTHPISKAISQFKKDKCQEVLNFKEISGKGISGEVEGATVLLGNKKLMDHFKIDCPEEGGAVKSSLTYIAVDNKYAGIVLVSDKIKEDSASLISELGHRDYKCTMLSGDKKEVVAEVATQIRLQDYKGELMPDEKYDFVFDLQTNGQKVVFVGDGVNDAPVIKLSDVGMAMGGLGSDAAIESADIVIQSDRPSKILTVLDIAKSTKKVVWQNIALAFFVKALVLVLGAWGMATLWQAVIADVGVALLAIINAMRIQKINLKGV